MIPDIEYKAEVAGIRLKSAAYGIVRWLAISTILYGSYSLFYRQIVMAQAGSELLRAIPMDIIPPIAPFDGLILILAGVIVGWFAS